MKKSSREFYYFRVSTAKQANTQTTIEHYISRGIKAGFTEGLNIFYDVASGGNRTRQNYQLLLDKAKRNEADAIYLPDDLSRLLRDVEEFKRFQRIFTESKVKLLNLKGDEYKFNAPEEILVSDIQMSFAEYERNRNKHKATIGHQYLRDMGRPVRPTFPYIRTKEQLIPNENLYKDSGKTVWEVARELVLTYIEVQNLSQTIAVFMKKYGADKEKGVGNDYPRDHSSFRDWLTCETIKGNLQYFGGRRYKRMSDPPEPIMVYKTHKPLITEDESRTILNILARGAATRSNSSKVVNLFVGKLFCYCGSPMKTPQSKTSSGSIFTYCYCKSAYPNSSAIKAKQEIGLISKCNYRSSYGMTIEKLESIVIEELCKKAEELANSYFPSVEEKIINPEISELDKQIRSYQILVKNDKDLEPLLSKKIRRREMLLKEEPINHKPYLRDKLITYGANKEFWNMATKNEKVILYSELINKIILKEGIPTITFNV